MNCEHSISDGFLFTLSFSMLFDTLSSRVGRETVFCLAWELSRFCRPFMTVRTFSIQTLGERMVLLSTSFFFIPCSLFVRSRASVTSLRSFSSQQQNFLRKPFSHIRGRSLGYFDFNARGDGSRLDRSICETMTY